MINPETIAIGNRYRNIKTRDVYEVVLISRDSEDPEKLLVSYDPPHLLNVLDGHIPWTRSLDFFAKKFEEVQNVSV